MNPAPPGTNRITPGSFAKAADFPAASFRSFEEFAAWQRDHEDLGDVRRAYEISLATHETVVLRPGTCGPCLLPARFVSGTQNGEKLPDGRFLPRWRDEQVCDCAHRLNASQRALLHVAQIAGVAPWTEALLLGAAAGVEARLSGMVGRLTTTARLRHAANAPNGVALTVPDGSHHLLLAPNFLHFVPPVARALPAIARAILPGGNFIFTTRFIAEARISVLMPTDHWPDPTAMPLEYRGDAHEFGWDLLAMLRHAGFSDAVAYLAWSEELGLLGPGNFVIRATR